MKSLGATEKLYRRALAEGLRPDPRLSVSDWADKYRVLPQESAAEPGPWRTDRTPYLKAIMDDLSAHSPVETVVFMKGSQIGGSECGFNWIGYVIDQAPGPMLMVLPTVGLAKRNSKQRIGPLITRTPRLRERVSPSRARDSGNTLLQKDYDGGTLVIAGANSAADLCNMPCRYLFLDELDRYPADVDGEGSPVALAEKRTNTFARRKKFKCSTPTIDTRSAIQAEYERSDKRRYHVPCPHCGHFQWLKWGQVRWPKGEPEKAVYHCESCDDPIQEHHKTAMLAAGRWIAEKPGAAGGRVHGYHLSALYSPVGWYSWGRAAAEFLAAENEGREAQKVFVNTVLGEVWKEKGDAPDWKRIYDRREKYKIGTVPRDALVLTAGADVQKDRIEVEIVGHGPNKETWSVDYRVFVGDTSHAGADPWQKLDELLLEQFPHESGQSLSILRLAVDSGYNTSAVYSWVRRYPVSRVMAVKGRDGQPMAVAPPKAVDVSAKGERIARGARVWNVGVTLLKSELYALLKIEKPLDGELYPPGFCHFPEYADEYFRQLTAEQVILKKIRGYTHAVWEKTRERNEALDCRIYARAAAVAIGIDRMMPEHWRTLAMQMGIPVHNGCEPRATDTNQSESAQPKATGNRR